MDNDNIAIGASDIQGKLEITATRRPESDSHRPGALFPMLGHEITVRLVIPMGYNSSVVTEMISFLVFTPDEVLDEAMIRHTALAQLGRINAAIIRQ